MADKSAFANVDRAKHGKLEELLTSIKCVEIAGKQVIQTPDGEFLEYVMMEEEFFVDNWLSQFAIGNVAGRNYFNQDAWNKMTDGYTKGVIVLNTDKEPVVLIRKFIDMDLNVNQAAYVEQYTRHASHAANMPNKEHVDAVVTSLADIISAVTVQNPEYDTLTAMIPYEYYLSKGVDPAVLKQVIYIRDTFTYKGETIDLESDLLKKVEAILYKNARDEKINKAEVALIDEITQGSFIFNDESNKVDNKVSNSTVEKPFDPLSD
jgi:hypothetical protein